MKLAQILVAMATMLLLCACQASAPQVEYNGVSLSSEEVRELGEGVKEQNKETEPQTQTEKQTEEETKELADGLVYWTDGGEVWHEWRTCNRISKKNPVISGSIEDAIAAKKDRGCSFCCE